MSCFEPKHTEGLSPGRLDNQRFCATWGITCRYVLRRTGVSRAQREYVTGECLKTLVGSPERLFQAIVQLVLPLVRQELDNLLSAAEALTVDVPLRV